MTEAISKMFSLRLSGDGINIEQEIDQRRALQVMQVVMGGDGPPVASSSTVGVGVRETEGVSLSLREYLDEIGAKKKPEQITTIAHYVCEFEGQVDFAREDIRARFLSAREPLPGNFGRDFAAAVQHGWIAEVHGKKNRFYVTAKGIQVIRSKFSNGKGAVARR